MRNPVPFNKTVLFSGESDLILLVLSVEGDREQLVLLTATFLLDREKYATMVH
jgi:hypothetical protein